jgi:multiple sugar transport system ATP-binding protein
MLYDFPCNLFVAGFIGSPSMNFFNGKIRKGDGKVYFEHEAFSVEIPENRKEVYAGMDGKDVVFGIRPENIHNPEFCPPGIVKADVAAKVDVTELMGNEIFVYCIAGSTQFSARVDPRSRYSIGSTVNLVFDMSNFHIFDPSVDSENPVAIR